MDLSSASCSETARSYRLDRDSFARYRSARLLGWSGSDPAVSGRVVVFFTSSVNKSVKSPGLRSKELGSTGTLVGECSVCVSLFSEVEVPDVLVGVLEIRSGF